MKKAKYLYHPESIRAMEDSGSIEGYASVFNVVDWYGTKTKKGCFKKTIKEKFPIPMLWNHDCNHVIGQWVYAEEDSRGLKVRGEFNRDIPLANEIFSNYKKGILRGLSIGGWIIKTERDENDGMEFVTEMALDEISPVTFPANESAMVEMVRAKTAEINLAKDLNDKLVDTVLKHIKTQLYKYKTAEQIEKEVLTELMSLRIKRATTREEATNLLIELLTEVVEPGGAVEDLPNAEADEIETSPTDEPILDHSDEIELLNLFKETKNVRKHSETG